MRVIFISGYAEDTFRRNEEKVEDLHFLPKPFGLKQLVAKVKEVLSGAARAASPTPCTTRERKLPRLQKLRLSVGVASRLLRISTIPVWSKFLNRASAHGYCRNQDTAGNRGRLIVGWQ